MSMIWEGRALDADQVAELQADPELLWDLDGEPPEVIDLDKSWHGIHWLLTGATGEVGAVLGQVIFGGEEFGEDEGYGPPRSLEPTKVAEVSEALEAVSDDDLRGRFDAAAMSEAGVYPDIWDEPDVLEDYLLPNVQILRDFYTFAAENQRYVVQSLA